MSMKMGSFCVIYINLLQYYGIALILILGKVFRKLYFVKLMAIDPLIGLI